MPSILEPHDHHGSVGSFFVAGRWGHITFQEAAQRCLDPLHVFIDTEVYRGNKFDWKNPLFRSLVERVDNGSMVILTTEVVLKEIEAGVAEELSNSLASLESAAKRTTLLRSVRAEQLRYLEKPDKYETLLAELYRDASRYLDRVNAIVVPLPDDVGPAMLTRYFQGAPPFGVGKKKAEFPDAANVLALERWAKDNYASIHVTSGDPDLAAACCPETALTHAPSLSALVSKALRSEWQDDSWTARQLLELLTAPSMKLEEKLAGAFELTPITVNFDEGSLGSFFIHHVDCEDLQIISCDDCGEYIRFDAELVHSVTCEADVYLGDDELLNELQWQVSGAKDLTALLELNLYPGDAAKLEINDVNYRNSDNLNFSVPMRF